MNTFDKLNLKGQKEIVVLNVPESFEPELAALRGVTVLRALPDALKEIEFALVFITKQEEVDGLGRLIANKARGDAVVWFAYPKGSSKRYKSEISRDHGWQVFGQAGFEPVRLIAIDEDWSALRLRRVEFIKTMTRAAQHRLSEKAKRATSK